MEESLEIRARYERVPSSWKFFPEIFKREIRSQRRHEWMKTKEKFLKVLDGGKK